MSKKPLTTVLAITIMVFSGIYFASASPVLASMTVMISPPTAANIPAITTQTTLANHPTLASVETPANTTSCNLDELCSVTKTATEGMVDYVATTTTDATANISSGPCVVTITERNTDQAPPLNTLSMWINEGTPNTYVTNTAENPWTWIVTSVAGLDAGNGFTYVVDRMRSSVSTSSTHCPWAIVVRAAYPNPMITGSNIT
ncbi:MAG: hypothetical protein V1685_02430 [Parcubacteria group bacterium]